jgi:hypothetical protein
MKLYGNIVLVCRNNKQYCGVILAENIPFLKLYNFSLPVFEFKHEIYYEY